MNMYKMLKAVTMGDTRQLRPMIGWTLAEYLFRGAPYGILLWVVWELFEPLSSPGKALDLNALLWASLWLVLSLAILYLISKKAYEEVYVKMYDLCAKGRLSIGEHLRRVSMGFFNARDPGVIGSYLIDDYANVEFLLTHIFPQVVGGVAMPVIVLLFLALNDWKLALISALVIPASLPVMIMARLYIRHFGARHQRAKVDASSRMLEYVQGMRLIKAFNLSGIRFDRLEKTFNRLRSLSIKLEAGAGPVVVLSSFVLHSGLTLIILFGLTFMLAGTMPLPVYIMFLIVGARVYEPLIQAFMFLAELNYFKLSVERLEALRTTPALEGGNPDMLPDNYNIAFVNVSFRYHSTEVLKDVSLFVPEKSLVAFVGPSGSGKTTMTRLIARFWDVNSGAISIGGKDVRAYAPEVVLASVSMVFQDVHLFSDTILNNIRIGRKDAAMDDVISAAQKARAHDFISKLPQGYDTLVGEGGSTLSGGEKQRISIARAILKDAPIILLDEATASLDPENELYIQEAINSLIKDKTVIIIAHRLNTVVHADMIFILDAGRIIQKGSHRQLLKTEGLYRRMWEEQQRVRRWKFR